MQRAEGFYRLSVIRALIPFIRVLPLPKGPTSKYIRVSISTCEFWRGTKLAVLKGIAKWKENVIDVSSPRNKWGILSKVWKRGLILHSYKSQAKYQLWSRYLFSQVSIRDIHEHHIFIKLFFLNLRMQITCLLLH